MGGKSFGEAATTTTQRLRMTKKQKLLVIDDSKETVAGLNSFLSQKYDVITAYNGLDGLKAFETNEADIDLVITDLVMPEISGVGVISIIKKKYPGIPVIAITGWGEHPGALATEAEADLVLDKPFELVDLERHVSELLAKKN
jgi:response regulator RpfG family c-di-GMP phosphodiesterase